MSALGTVQARVSLLINNGNLQYQNRPQAFNSSIVSTLSATPGGFLASVDGTDVDLSQLTQPSLCILKNTDPTNFVTYGLYDETSDYFEPFGEIQPGEFYLLRLSRYLLSRLVGTGTGTAGMGATSFRFKADMAPCQVSVECFDP